MAKCDYKRRKKTIVCTGNMRKQIILLTRNLDTKGNIFTDPIGLENTFTTLATVWAMNEDAKGQEVFDSVGLRIGQHTDNWYIRYFEGITSQTWVQFEEDYYKILNVRDLQRNHLYLKLECEFRGSTLKDAARA